MKKCYCYVVIMGILTSLLPTNDIYQEPEEFVPFVIDIPEEVIEVVKYDQFELVSGTNSRLQDLINMRNLGFFDGDYYTSEVSGGSFDIYIETSITDAASGAPAHSFDISPIGGAQFYSDPVLRIVYIDAKWYLCAAVGGLIDNAGKTSNYYTIFKNLTDGGGWVDDSELGVGADAIENLNIQIMDIYSYGTDLDIIYYQHSHDEFFGYATVAKATGVLTDNGAFLTDGFSTATSIYSGNYDGTNYKFLYKDDSEDYQLVSVPSNFVETVTEQTVTLAPSDPRIQQYWDFGDIEILMDWKFFYVRDVNNVWVPFTDAGGTATNAIVLGYDSNNRLTIKYIVWKDTIYIITGRGLPEHIQQTAVDAFVGWENWFANGATAIYQVAKADL